MLTEADLQRCVRNFAEGRAKASEFYNEQQDDFEAVTGDFEGDTQGGYVRPDYIHFSFVQSRYIPGEAMNGSYKYLMGGVYSKPAAEYGDCV